MSKQGEGQKNPWKSFRLVESDGKLSKKLNRLAKLGKQSVKGSRSIYKKLQGLEETLIDRFDRDEVAEALAATKQRLGRLEQKLKGVKEVLEEEESRSLETLQEIRTRIEKYSTEAEYNRQKKAIEKNIEQLEDLRVLRDQNSSQDYWEPLIKGAKNVLEHQGVKILEGPTGEFKPDTQEVIETRETGEKGRDGEIAEVFGFGYRYLDGRLIKPMKVAVYKHSEELKEVSDE